MRNVRRADARGVVEALGARGVEEARVEAARRGRGRGEHGEEAPGRGGSASNCYACGWRFVTVGMSENGAVGA